MSFDGSGAKFDSSSVIVRPEMPILVKSVPVMERIISAVKIDGPELTNYWKNVGNLEGWGGVMLGIKPGAVADSEHNRWMLSAIKEIDPQLGSSYDVVDEIKLNVYNAGEIVGGRNDTVFVNRNSLVDLVSNNTDFFRLDSKAVVDYSIAKIALISAFGDSERVDIARGLINGFNRRDCEAYVEIMPIMGIARLPQKDRITYYTNLGFGKIESKFIDKFIGGSGGLRSLAVELFSSIVPITERQKKLLKSRIGWDEKLSGTRWMGFAENKIESARLVKKYHKAFIDSGMDKIIS